MHNPLQRSGLICCAVFVFIHKLDKLMMINYTYLILKYKK